MTDNLLTILQRKVAVSAIPASAMRNQGAVGVAEAARRFLADLALSPFATTDGQLFVDQLDNATDGLRRSLPRQARTWGVARKAVNLFLRDAYYNKFLHDAYQLSIVERHLEIPLDSVIATALHNLPGGDSLSPWRGVKYLPRAQSDEYQAFAQLIADVRQLSRVHLDAALWTAYSRRASSL
jgi:hypothetical protein